MADIVINHRIGTTRGHGGMYNRYDGSSLPWDEHAVTSCTGGKVSDDMIHLSHVSFEQSLELFLKKTFFF